MTNVLLVRADIPSIVPNVATVLTQIAMIAQLASLRLGERLRHGRTRLRRCLRDGARLREHNECDGHNG
jgi:hypothetical protein